MKEITNTVEKDFCEVIPAADVVEENDKAIIYFEVPGSASKDVCVQVEDSILTIEAGSSLFRNGAPILYKRSFSLADSVEIDKITAKTADGVLTLVLPKSDHAQVHKITVE